jgi:hypothetical protein
MGRTKTVSPLTKFYKWKYSGLIVVPSAVVLILLVWFSYTSSLEFFDYWSCDTISNYMMNIDVPSDITPHNDLTEEQHMKLHGIYQECADNDRFSEPMKHE